tara:strand:+ start:425 stop:643 length:219 start_codon:yes stop_codon:yes gene_type:complete
MKNTKPMLKILKIVQNPDGSALMTFDINDEFKQLVREKTNVKRVSKKRLNAFILDALSKAVYVKEGWTLTEI